MDFTFEMSDDVVILITKGNLVASEISILRQQIEELIAKKQCYILFDMSQISFMDSSGLDTIMATNNFVLSHNGIFVCAALRDNVLKIFRITWADQKIPIAKTRSDGLGMIQAMRENNG